MAFSEGDEGCCIDTDCGAGRGAGLVVVLLVERRFRSAVRLLANPLGLGLESKLWWNLAYRVHSVARVT